ncbi:histidine kinase [uncultured Bacteroides sp.]|uniref:sensor histidine kinase n=1 Tax=uncultured Bacteroides sp. TaxID=162156 RepID=UPI0025F29E74|nr:histidine kinase [uncultured Bacteroides sp.]
MRTLLHTLLNQTGIFLAVSFLVIRGTFVEDISIGLNVATGVNLLLSLTLWGTICLHTYWLLPEYLFQGKYKAYIAYISCFILFMLLVMIVGNDIMGKHYAMPDTIRTIGPDFFFYLFLNALGLILYFFAFSFTIFLRQWVSYHQRLNELENNSIQTELNHLKDQLQPDFLSHMLNKASSLSKEDSGRASALIFKLSRLLRYQLYDSNQIKVLLADDIRFISDYLELEQLYNLNFHYHIRMDNEARYFQIPPLLFMPIIECAIQERMLDTSDSGRALEIGVRAESNILHFSCSYYLKGDNQIKNNTQQTLPAFNKFRQRLELLYPKRYHLDILQDENMLCVTKLMIKL